MCSAVPNNNILPLAIDGHDTHDELRPAGWGLAEKITLKGAVPRELRHGTWKPIAELGDDVDVRCKFTGGGWHVLPTSAEDDLALAVEDAGVKALGAFDHSVGKDAEAGFFVVLL